MRDTYVYSLTNGTFLGTAESFATAILHTVVLLTMGPIMQEQTASATLKRLPSKEKVRMKNAENTGIVASNNKRGGNVNQNKKPAKKIVTSHPGQDKDPLSKAETVPIGMKPKKAKSPTAGTGKLRGTQGELDLKPPRPKLSCTERRHERQKIQPESQCCSVIVQSHVSLEKSKRALSLPLAPQPVLHPISLQKRISDLEALRLMEHKEDDTDSASDLSDSERLPVLPSPCTPPQLNLRAEVIDSMDLHPHIPGPRMLENDTDASYSYPDFLPPPFNTWSLRQLAIFLNTEGKRAPRPKPVGQLERYLERLLQLEWHQIQTIHTESGRHGAPFNRARGYTPGVSVNSNRPRPHTAPPTRLSSPKSLRQRAFPLALVSSTSCTSSSQLSRPVCPHCHIRYPLCNGSCSSYAYQRHSRLSPLLERRAPPVNGQKRSSSESRASENHSTSKNQHLISPQATRVQQRHMQAVGNVRRASQELNPSKSNPSCRKGKTGRSNDTEKQKDQPVGGKCAGADRRVAGAVKRDGAGPVKRGDRDGQRVETGEQRLRSGAKRTVVDICDSKATSVKATGKIKNVQYK